MSARSTTSLAIAGALGLCFLACASVGAAAPVALVRATVTAASTVRHTVSPTRDIESPHGGPQGDSGVPEHDQYLPKGWQGEIAAAMLIALVLVVSVFAARWLLRQRVRVVTDRPLDDDLGEISDWDDAALRDEIRAGTRSVAQRLRTGELGADEAIIECWRRIQDASARVGVVRAPAQTAGDFTAAVLEKSNVSPGAIAELQFLYERAQFDSWAPDDADAVRAHDCVDRILADLGEAS